MGTTEEKQTISDEIQREMLLVADMMRALNHFNDAPKTHGRKLGYIQEKALRIIAENDGILQRELQDLMDSRPSAISLLLAKLEEAGFIQKTMESSDSRKVNIRITDDGKRYIEEHEAIDEEVDPTLCLNEEEREYYLSFTERIIEYLGAEMRSRGMKPIGPGIAKTGAHRSLPPLGDRPGWNEKYCRGPEKARLPFDHEHYGEEDEGPFWKEHPDWPNPWVKDKGKDPFF